MHNQLCRRLDGDRHGRFGDCQTNAAIHSSRPAAKIQQPKMKART